MVILNLERLLKRRKMTRYALAKATGLSLSAIYRLERPGKAKRIEYETIDLLCEHLNCTPGQLLRRVE